MRWLLVFSVFWFVDAQVKKPCCWSPQYEVLESRFDEHFSSSRHHFIDREESVKISYDHFNKRESREYARIDTERGLRHFKRVYDFDKDIEYVVYNVTHCNRRRLQGRRGTMEGHCMPDNAKFHRTSYYGKDENTLTMDTWVWQEVGEDHVVHMDVSPNGCVPITRTHRGHVGNSTYMSVSMWAYLNYETGIRDDRVFDIPPECKPEPDEHAVNIIG